MHSTRVRVLGALFLGALLLSSCSNPESEKVWHLQRGNQCDAEKRDAFAVVEYASAVKLNPKFGEARFKLQTFERMNNLRAALPWNRAHSRIDCRQSRELRRADVLAAAGPTGGYLTRRDGSRDPETRSSAI